MRWNGKGYDEQNNIIYEFKNGNSKIKDHDNNGKLTFEEEYLNGKLNGEVKVPYITKFIYRVILIRKYIDQQTNL